MLKENSVFVKFFSPSCPHCQRMVPVWEQVGSSAATSPEPFKTGDVNCAESQSLCERFGIRGVPSLIFFKEGKMYKFSGNREYNDIMKFGGGDYKKSIESADVPSAGGSGVLGKASYSFLKFLKDLHAILRFNQWAVFAIFLLGFLVGGVVTFTGVMLSLRGARPRVVEAATAQEVDAAPEKSAVEKKAD